MSAAAMRLAWRGMQLAAIPCVALLPSIAFAQVEGPLSCTRPQNTLEINECALREFELRDRQLNEAYRALTQSLKPDAAGDAIDYGAVRTRLVSAQKAWVAYRDADCLAQRQLHAEGSGRAAVQLGCLVERTTQRTRELQAWRLP